MANEEKPALDEVSKLKIKVNELYEILQECQLTIAEQVIFVAADGENIKKIVEGCDKLIQVVQNHDKVLTHLTAAMRALNAKLNGDEGGGSC